MSNSREQYADITTNQLRYLVDHFSRRWVEVVARNHDAKKARDVVYCRALFLAELQRREAEVN